MDRITVSTIQKMKRAGEKIVMLTAYDYSTAKYADEAGADMILVGDSAAMVVMGYETTNQIGMTEMLVFTKAAANGAQRSLVVGDLPFLSYQLSVKKAVLNAGKLIQQGAGAVKLEGASDFALKAVARMTETGIPVVGHLGFTPQSVKVLGGYKVQGKSAAATLKMLEDAKKLQDAGAFAVVLEMVPEESARYITENLDIPTIGIGAGAYTSGQVLVSDDILGKYPDFAPKFSKKYADLRTVITSACADFVAEVKNGAFPTDKEAFHMPEADLQELQKLSSAAE